MLSVNATYAKKHSVLLDVVHVLAQSLAKNGAVISTIRFDFITPTGGMLQVSNEVRGQLCLWHSLRGEKWPDSTVSVVLAGAGCIAVCELESTTK